ncbi:major facilitator superfamily domain-containing protein [Lipomyces tetrasporus]|uniref:Major facilitator superfamily domain-containing protein n=1 Tax=Lipomyces tetrasporus TaxID=54092 RepID=A0AAD7QN84_9ASCO|nr:major facilitator superfamily domain-containing protein [Lipomyces tetrasporus]KAJ8098309.1 major facilitator superfamily domain-containing protein [Lipomyces tetrasporus]
MTAGEAIDNEREEYRPRDLSSHQLPSASYRDDPDAATVSDASIRARPFHPYNSKWWKRPSIYVLLPAYLVHTVAEGALIAPSLNAILTMVCSAYHMQPDQLEAMEDISRDCQTADVHAIVARFTMIIGLIQGILAALVSPKLGALSDRIGRRPVLAITAIGPVAHATIFVAAMKSASPHAYRWLLISPIVEGLTGSMATMMLIVHAYATDCTPPVKRAHAFGLFRACMFGGVAFGPVFGGMLIELTNNIMSVIYVSLVMETLFALFILFVLPESLSQERMIDAEEVQRIGTEFDAARARDMHYYLRRLNFNFFQPLRVLWPNDGTRPTIKKNIAVLSAIETIVAGCSMGVTMTVLLYAEYTFHWTSVETGLFISLASVARVIALLVVLPAIMFMYKRLRPHAQHEVGASKSDIFVIRMSVVCDAVSFLLMASATNGAEFAIGGALGALGSLGSPTIHAAITKHVPKESTGAVLGALSLMNSLSGIVAPIIFSNIYASTVASNPKVTFFAAILIFAVACVLSLFITEHLGGSLFDSGDGLDMDDRRQSGNEQRSVELETENALDTDVE